MSKEVYWSGVVEECQLCGGQLSSTMYDARTPRGWANTCHSCFRSYGLQLGTGRGQKYKRQADKRWLKVEG